MRSLGAERLKWVVDSRGIVEVEPRRPLRKLEEPVEASEEVSLEVSCIHSSSLSIDWVARDRA